jgi:hypothetical protein
MALEPARDRADSIADVVDVVLDKGLVINADIMVCLAGVELLGIKVRAALASFETAARYGLEFPSGTNLAAPAWRQIAAGGEDGLSSASPVATQLPQRELPPQPPAPAAMR